MPDLAIFDLDNTLLAGDSDYAWGRWLIQAGRVDEAARTLANERFYRQYQAGTLDIHEYTAFVMAPVMAMPRPEADALRHAFAEARVRPMIAPGAPALLAGHRARGDDIVLTTATNRFIVEPIARLLGIPPTHLLATDPEEIDGRFTGRVAGTANFQGGKVTRLKAWLAQREPYATTTAYSDSHNDLPLLEMADVAVAVDPDATLEQAARQRGWTVLSLRLGTSQPPRGPRGE